MTQAQEISPQEQKQGPEITIVRSGYARGKAIPWQLKMWIKIILSKIPFSYSFLSRIGIFRHGDTSRDLKTLYGSFDDHISFYKQRVGKPPEYALELGSGDSVGHALCGKAQGVKSMWLIDVGDYATKDEVHYAQIYSDLGFKENPPRNNFSRASIIEFADSYYKTDGLMSFRDIPDQVIDFSFSHAVLEHIYHDEFQAHMNELYRTHKVGGLSRHWVDLHDHLGGALNNMRFSPKFWESKHVKGAGFYTNRLTMDDMINMAQKAGFEVNIERVHKWEELPTPYAEMHPEFHDKGEEELNVCTFLMVMEKK